MFKGKRFSLKGNIGLTFLSCLAVSALIIIFLSLIFAIVANTLEDPTGNLGIFSFAVLIIGAAAGGFISAKMKKEGAVVFSSLVALTLTLIMLVICLITDGGVNLSALMNYLCYIGVASLGATVGAKEGRHKHHKK